MTSRLTALERAFELARSGDCLGIAEIRAQLKVEGFSLGQLEGPSLVRQLREICAASRGASDDVGATDTPRPTTDVVSRVLIRCPETGQAVDAVLRLRPSAFEALRGDHGFRCARCGKVHTWRKEDAWLEPATRPRRA